MAIAQGTTPTHTFTLPFDSSIIKTIHIVYSQNNEVVFVRKDDNVVKEGNTVHTKLTQEETLMLDPDRIVEIQLRILTLGEDALNSDIILRSVEECLEKVVLE